MQNTVVTGGAGFIGSHLVERLLAAGANVAIVDNFATGRRSNVAGFGNRVGVHEVDICDQAGLELIFRGADTVFHLAGLADIVPSIERPSDYFKANVDGTFSVMQAVRASGVRRVVYAASSSCYGIPDQYPTGEEAPIRPQYPYALTKYLGERIVMHFGQVYGIGTLSLRLFNVYGPRSRTAGTYGAVFGVFLAQKIAAKPYTVVGDGSQCRDFTYVGDVANAFIRAAESDARGEIMNVGSGQTYSVNRLVELLQGPVSYVPKRPGEPDMTYADVTKIRRILNWNAEMPFEDGVKTMLECIDDWKDAPVWDPSSIAIATEGWFKHLGGSAQTRPQVAVS